MVRWDSQQGILLNCVGLAAFAVLAYLSAVLIYRILLPGPYLMAIERKSLRQVIPAAWDMTRPSGDRIVLWVSLWPILGVLVVALQSLLPSDTDWTLTWNWSFDWTDNLPRSGEISVLPIWARSFVSALVVLPFIVIISAAEISLFRQTTTRAS